MFVQSKSTINPKHKNGLALRSRRGGADILVQWSNGEQRWCDAIDIEGAVTFVDLERSGHYEDNDHGS